MTGEIKNYVLTCEARREYEQGKEKKPSSVTKQLVGRGSSLQQTYLS